MSELMRATKKKSAPGASRIRVSNKDLRTLDGVVFDSKAEMNRFAELKMMERAGIIKDLKCQVKFILQEKFKHEKYGNIRAIEYIADFSYIQIMNGKTVIEDCKGMLTDKYLIKRKLFLFKYPDIDYREIHAK